MITRVHKTLSTVIAAALLCVALAQPKVVDAQASGVGGDGNTSLLWKGTDGSISLWRLDPTVSFLTASATYGPYGGWTPVALTTDIASYTHVLWRYSDGTVAFWSLDPSLNFASSQRFGPFFGWVAETLSADPSTGGTRIIWKRTDGAVAVWVVNPNGSLAYDGIYGPYFGYNPGTDAQTGPRALHAGTQMPSAKHVAAESNSKKAAAAAMARHH